MLRALNPSTAVLACLGPLLIATLAAAQTNGPDGQGDGTTPADEPREVIEFAPGADGDIGINIPDVLDRARRLGEAWEDRLDIQEPDSFGRDYDIDAMRDRALNNPRVRALLDAGDSEAGPDVTEARYGNAQVFLLASFSMPAPTLRAMMEEADALDVPVLFRGFVNNSVYDTQAALQETFGDDADLQGFGIDPTVFTRFGVEAVPTVIVTAAPLDVCQTAGCADDVPPLHDKIAGNIPLRAALDIVARGEGEARQVARDLLVRAEGQP